MKFIDKSLLINGSLIIADLHLGYEQALQEQGIFLPRLQYKKIKEDLDKIFDEIDKMDNEKAINKKQKINNKGELVSMNIINNKKVDEIIILGDLKHEFGSVLQQEWRETLDLLAYLKKKARKIIIVRGNHDNYLINVVKKLGIKLVDFYVSNGVCFLHGHKIFNECLDKKIKMLVMGHKHPAITLRKEAKSERYKCFLVGKWKGKEIIILPSFFPLIEGSDVFIEDTNLAFPFKLSGFEVYVVGDERKVYGFGKVDKVGRLG